MVKKITKKKQEIASMGHHTGWHRLLVCFFAFASHKCLQIISLLLRACLLPLLYDMIGGFL